MIPRWCLVALVLCGAGPRSGYEDAQTETRAMQDDDAANPGFLWVRDGEASWSHVDGGAGKSCASCHGDIGAMRGVGARYPAFDPERDRIVTIEDRLNFCRVDRMGAEAFAWDDDRLLGLSALMGLQSRGLAMVVVPREPFFSEGAGLFRQRIGQFNVSCAQCHDDLAGQKLAGSVIPQGQPNGYPEYRLSWQGMGSLYRRVRNCMTGVRAEPFSAESRDYRSLAHYLGVRATGLTVETPGVRP